MWPEQAADKFLSELVHFKVNRTIHLKIVKTAQNFVGELDMT